MKKIIIGSVACASLLCASGYKIPEQSLASTAKSAANVANLTGADASYYNPAAMSTLESRSQLETSLTWIHLPSVDFDGTYGSYSSKKENFAMPDFHYVSPKVGDYTFGLSVVSPAGLSKRWDDAVPQTTTEEFTLRVIEVNPTVSYAVNDAFSIGGGLRVIYSDGIVKSDGIIPVDMGPFGVQTTNISRDLTGDTIEFGYNLAMHYHPNNDWQVGLTYRSKVDLDIEGDAELASTATLAPFAPFLDATYDGGASVSVPLPATLSLAVAYDITDSTNIEFVFDRTFWSSYKKLDFDYSGTLTSAVLISAFDDPKDKDWKDVNAYRLGITHQYSPELTLMGGIAYDKTPVPNSTIGYELPDSNAWMISGGFQYQVNENLSLGAAYLYDRKKSRDVSGLTLGESGEFTDGGAHLLTLSLGYKF